MRPIPPRPARIRTVYGHGPVTFSVPRPQTTAECDTVHNVHMMCEE